MIKNLQHLLNGQPRPRESALKLLISELIL